MLPYLVRRLLENGANTSFVHALLDARVPADQVVQDPVALVAAQPGPHPKIPSPANLYGAERRNPLGRDYSIREQREAAARADRVLDRLSAGPIVGGRSSVDGAAVVSPSDPSRVLGHVAEATTADIDRADRACQGGTAALGRSTWVWPGPRLARDGCGA